MPRRLIIGAGGGLLAAMLYKAELSGFAGGMILAYIASLPLFVVGLSIGLLPAVMAGGVGAAVATIGDGWMAGVMFSCLFFAPTLVVVWQALDDGLVGRKAGPARVGMTILWLTGLGFAVLFAAWLSCLKSPGGLPAISARVLSVLLAAAPIGYPAGDLAMRGVVRVLALLLPGILVLSWLFMIVVNGALAQGVLVRFRRNIRPAPALSSLALPSWVVIALAGVTGAAVLGRGSLAFLGVNGLVVLILPFFFAGLAVLHAATQRSRLKMALRVAFYVVMLLSGWPVLLLTVVGVADQWLGMRQKLASVR